MFNKDEFMTNNLLIVKQNNTFVKNYYKNRASMHIDNILSGNGSTIIMGRKGMEETKDIQSVRYIAPAAKGCHITGYYKVESARWIELPDEEYPIRITFDVADWIALDTPAKFGLVRYAYRGVCKTKEQFFNHCKEQAVIDGKLPPRR